MATIKLYFDDRRPDKHGCGQLKVVIRSRGTTTSCNLGFPLPVGSWDDVHQKVVSHPALREKPKMLNSKIDAEFVKIQFAFRKVAGIKTNLSAKTLLERTLAEMYGQDALPVEDKLLKEVLDEFTSKKEAGTRLNIYGQAWKFLDSQAQVGKMNLSKISQDTIEDWYELLLKHLSINTAATYASTVLAVLHYAHKKKYIDWNASLKVKHASTKSRALTIEELRKILTYRDSEEFKKLTWAKKQKMANTIKAFTFSFACCGLNLADIYDIRPKDFVKGRLQKDRKKTGTRIDMLLQPEALEAWDGLVLNENKAIANQMFNRYLDEIVPGTTMYYARHSWASVANKLGVPNETIALGLAHKYGGLTNQVYVQKDYALLDEANRKILDYVYGKDNPRSDCPADCPTDCPA